LGELAGYTPEMGGTEDGDGKGSKVYGVTGMTDDPGSVSTLILGIVRSTEEGRGELLFREENGLAGLGIEGVPECQWVGDKGEGDGERDVDKVESEGTADARAAAMRATTAEVRMNA
jgi:hypothetical protein